MRPSIFSPILSILFVLVLTSFPHPAFAGDFASAMKDYRTRDFTSAFGKFHALAQEGDADSQYNLALMYHHGKGTDQDFTQAAKWYLRAAEQGNPSAQYNLGLMYGNGMGISQDFIQAYIWLSRSAQGFASGQHQEQAARNRDRISGRMSPAERFRAEIQIHR